MGQGMGTKLEMLKKHFKTMCVIIIACVINPDWPFPMPNVHAPPTRMYRFNNLYKQVAKEIDGKALLNSYLGKGVPLWCTTTSIN